MGKSLIHDVPKARMYQILRRDRNLKSVKIGDKIMKFKNKIFHVKDRGIAQAIADKYPNSTMSIPHDSWRDDPTGVHNFHFGLSKLGNWHDKIDWSK